MAQLTALQRLNEWVQLEYAYNNRIRLAALFQKTRELIAVEKEQIRFAYYAGMVDTDMIRDEKRFIYEGPEDYYNKTFNHDTTDSDAGTNP